MLRGVGPPVAHPSPPSPLLVMIMIITYTGTTNTLRGVSGGRKYSTMGAAMRARGSQVLRRNTLRRSRFTQAETRGKEAINTLVHDFANLSNEERESWNTYRKKIKWEWQTRSPCGPEQTHPKCITFSELDFFVACNHHRALAGQPSIKVPRVVINRPWIIITGVIREDSPPNTYRIGIDTNLWLPEYCTVWMECAPPNLSPGVRPSDNQFYQISDDTSQCLQTIYPGQQYIDISGIRYDPQAGDNWHVRALKHNRGLAPYGYTYWHGTVDHP